MPLVCSAQEFHELCLALSGRADRLRLQVKGGSMHPFIQSGDWVWVLLYRGSGHERPPRKGDIALFALGDTLYMHRVLKRRPDGLCVVKGDQSFGFDGLIGDGDILGRVVSVERSSPRSRRTVDLDAPVNRLASVFMADASAGLQYLFLAARGCGALACAALGRIQALGLYRRLAKKWTGQDSVEIREADASTDDVEGLRDLYIMSGHDVKKDIEAVRQEGFWLVAERKKKVVGALTVTRYLKDPAVWIIFGLEVKPRLRGLGIGGCLVAEAVRRATGNGAREIGLFVNKRNKPAVALYRKAGFVVSEDYPHTFNRGEDELWLSRNLSRSVIVTLAESLRSPPSIS